MSSRNSRVVRNRENGNNNRIKIIVITSVVALVILLAVIAVVLKNHHKVEKKIADFDGDVAYEYFILSTSNGLGVIDKNGKNIIDTIYNDIYIPNASKDVFLCYEEDKAIVLNQSGEKILTDYENVQPINTSDNSQTEKYLLKYEKDGLYGLLDLDGNIVSKPVYEKITSLENRPGRILVQKDDKYGVMDAEGNILIDVKYDSILADDYCSSTDLYKKTGYIVATKGENGLNYGYLNAEGKMLLDTKYETIERALEYEDDNIYLIAMQNGKKGIFKNKKKMIDLNFQEIFYSDLSDVFVVNKNGKYGFYNLNGKIILKPQYESYSIAGNYISVSKDGETQLFDINGNVVDTAFYKKMIETENPTYFIAENDDGFCSIISKDVKIDNQYTQISYAFDDYFIFTDTSGKMGVINALIQEIEIEPQYDFILLIDGSKALQAVNGVNGFVDIYSSDLEKTISMPDGIVEKIDDKYAVIYSENDMKYIDENGNKVENTDIYDNRELYAIQIKDKWGFCNKNGNLVVDCEYDIVTELNEYGFAGVKKDGKWGVIDRQGKIVIEPTYELDTYYFPKFVGKYQLVEANLTYCEEIE